MLRAGKIVQHGTLAEVLGDDEPIQVPSGLQRVLAEAGASEQPNERMEVSV